ncbi:MAG: DEAD/DEAH box helicase [Anaerolineae bacterium]|nr:DEAD/DEAH box helicase [Anaerolineae bacterium]
MIALHFQDETLSLDNGGTGEIFEWQHRLFFVTILEYKLDEVHHSYSFSRREDVAETLQETVEYLTSEGLEFEVDKEAAAFLQRLRDEQKDYECAIQRGLEAQNSKSVPDLHPAFTRKLKPYQLQGLRHLLAVKHGANFSVPGSGKTTVVYAAFEILRRQGIVEKLLVVGPRSCFGPWEEEFEACFGYPAQSIRLSGPKASRYGAYLESSKPDLFLCTYQTAANDVSELITLCQRHAMLVVLDESHNIKKLMDGVWSEAMLKIAPYATRRVILSGTPMPNSYEDLWTQMTFLWPGRQVLGERAEYRFRCEDQPQHANIRQAVQPFFVRVTKPELKLPPPNFERIECGLKPYQASIYRALSARFLREIDVLPEDRMVLRQWRKAKMVRLIQAASNPALLAQYSEEFDVPPLSGEGASVIQLIDEYPRYEIPAKVEYVVQLVHRLLKQNEKVVVWTSFVHNIRTLQYLLSDVQPFIVYGAVPRDESEDTEFNREQQIRQFKETQHSAVLLANPAACAESISLHRTCRHAVYLDRTFNCGQYMQSLDRIHRIGLGPEEIVTYHILIAPDTVDETIERRLEEKQLNMILLLEGELPTGTLEVESHQIGQSENEEAVDFEETMRDIKRQLELAGTDATIR